MRIQCHQEMMKYFYLLRFLLISIHISEYTPHLLHVNHIRLLLLAWKKHECLCFVLDWCLPVLKCSLIIFFSFRFWGFVWWWRLVLNTYKKTLVFVGFARKDSNVIYVPECTFSSHYWCTGKQPCNEMNCWWECVCVWKYFVYWLWTCP